MKKYRAPKQYLCLGLIKYNPSNPACANCLKVEQCTEEYLKNTKKLYAK
jgi:hypothetical protein